MTWPDEWLYKHKVCNKGSSDGLSLGLHKIVEHFVLAEIEVIQSC